MRNRPLIGITAFETRYIDSPHLPIFALNRRYVMAVEAAGGAPVMLPPGLSGESLRALFDRLDGLLLSGGGDIDPVCYGETPHPATKEVSADRDQMELDLARWAMQTGKAMLSICRGIQVFNVALGGTLVQDIPSQVAGALAHTFDATKVAREYQAHTVRIDPDTRLREVMQVEQAGVNSWHHQSVKQAAPGLRVTALSPDGVIEAMELPGHRFALGVQWHPEWLYDHQPEMKRLFEALVQAAVDHKTQT
jgi:putative glutamine amidotransferase